MGRFVDLTGKKFNRWTVIERAGSTKNGAVLWRCRCDCGNEGLLSSNTLTSGHSKSCGCYNREVSKERLTTHGLRYHPLYDVWAAIKGRCYQPQHEYHKKSYKDRGIKVCDKWRDDPQAFILDCIELGWKSGLTIDRIDNDGDYEPGNIRFVDMSVQAANRKPRGGVPFAGVKFDKNCKRYILTVFSKGKTIFYKSCKYEDLQDAFIDRDLFILTNDLPHTLNVLKRPSGIEAQAGSV